jgi:hypothetical protein
MQHFDGWHMFSRQSFRGFHQLFWLHSTTFDNESLVLFALSLSVLPACLVGPSSFYLVVGDQMGGCGCVHTSVPTQMRIDYSLLAADDEVNRKAGTRRHESTSSCFV